MRTYGGETEEFTNAKKIPDGNLTKTENRRDSRLGMCELGNRLGDLDGDILWEQPEKDEHRPIRIFSYPLFPWGDAIDFAQL